MDDLVSLLESAAEGSEELDAEIVARLNNAVVKRYPPTDDFGPRNRWQFWSEDGKHFLGNESKFPIPPLTRSIDAALTLVPGGWWAEIHHGADRHNCVLQQFPLPCKRIPAAPYVIAARTTPLALCIAALKAMEPTR